MSKRINQIQTGIHGLRPAIVSIDGYSVEAVTYPLSPTINTLSNPMTWTFASLTGTGYNCTAISNGKAFVASDIAQYTLSEPAISNYQLRLIYLKDTTAQIASFISATCATNNCKAIIINRSSTHTAGIFNLKITNGNFSWDDGPSIPIVYSRQIFRLYRNNNIDWVDVGFIGPAPIIDVSDVWTFYNEKTTLKNQLAIARAPYWKNGAVSTWGFDIQDPQFATKSFTDLREFGIVDASAFNSSAKNEINKFAAKHHLLCGVSFDHTGKTTVDPDAPSTKIANKYDTGSFSATLDENLKVTQIGGGQFWVDGKEYSLSSSIGLAGLNPTETGLIVYAVVSATGTTSFLITEINLITEDFVKTLRQQIMPDYISSNSIGDGVQYYPQKCPLYILKNEGSEVYSVLLDLRRDVAFYNSWTVASRENFLMFDDGYPNTQPVPGNSASKLIAEFSSIGSALVWHGITFEHNSVTHFGGTFSAFSANIKVVGKTYETYPLTLWNNVSIQGEGKPDIILAPCTLDGYETPSTHYTYMSIGAPSAVLPVPAEATLIHNIKISDVNIQAAWIPDTHVDGYICQIYAPTPAQVTTPETSTCQNVIFENVEFGVAIPTYSTGVLVSNSFGIINFNRDTNGKFSCIKIKNCRTSLSEHKYNNDMLSPFNIGVCSSDLYGDDVLEIDNCHFVVEKVGIGLNIVQDCNKITISNNYIETTHASTDINCAGIQFTPNNSYMVSNVAITNNTFVCNNIAAPAGIIDLVPVPPTIFAIKTDKIINRFNISNNKFTAPVDSVDAAISTYTIKNGSIANNTSTGFAKFIFAADICYDSNIANNTVSSTHDINTGFSSAKVVDFSAGCDNISFIANSFTTGDTAIALHDPSNTKIVDNYLAPNFVDLTIELVGPNRNSTGIILTGTTTDTIIANNNIDQFRVGISCDIENRAENIKINDNIILGQDNLIENEDGYYNSKGIYIYVTAEDTYMGKDLKLDITNNVIVGTSAGPKMLEMLTDGNMESAATTAWSSANAVLSKQTSLPYEGTRWLRIISSGGPGDPVAYQSVLTIGKTYHLSGWAKGDGTVSPSITDSLGTNIWTGNESTGWQQISVSFTAVSTQLHLKGDVDGLVGFDGVSCTLGQSLDTTIGCGGIIIKTKDADNTYNYTTKGIYISGNYIEPTERLDSYSLSMPNYVNMFGILLYSDGPQLFDAKITENVIKINSNMFDKATVYSVSGIACICSASNTQGLFPSINISNNDISIATNIENHDSTDSPFFLILDDYVPSITLNKEIHGAGIFMNGPWHNTTVSSNNINVHALTDYFTEDGYFGVNHGIRFVNTVSDVFYVESSGFIRNTTITNNKISTDGTVVDGFGQSITTYMTVGTAVIIESNITNAQISENNISGAFVLPKTITCPDWGIITLAMSDDFTFTNTSINNNIVKTSRIVQEDYVHLPHGIIVGQTFTSTPTTVPSKVQIIGNNLDLQLDSRNSTATSAAIYTNAINASGIGFGTYLSVQDNLIYRKDNTNGTAYCAGIKNNGFKNSMFSNNIIVPNEQAYAPELVDINVSSSMPADNVWIGNRYGTSTATGLAELPSPPRIPMFTNSNWSGEDLEY